MKQMMKAQLLAAACAVLPLVACASGEANAPEDQGGAAPAAAPEVGDGASAAPADGSTWEAGGTIPSGQDGVKPIEILEVRSNGVGPVCGNGKSATLAYKAMKADGSVLDPGSRPFTFTVGSGGAIKGWDVVVAKIRVDDDFTIMLPQELAYGPSRGDLKFNMKLLSFK